MELRALVVLVAVGCAPDLPSHPLGDAAVEVFRAFDDDPGSLPALVAALDAQLDDFDLDARGRDNLIALPGLGVADLGGADVPAEIDTSDQFRVGLSARSSHDLADNLLAQVQENQTCINADAVKCHARRPADDTDPQDLVDGTVDVYRTDNVIRIQTLPIDFWVEAPVDFRRLTLDDGRQAAVSRTWLRQAYTNDNDRHTWSQRFGVDVFVEDPDGTTRRFYGTWVGPTVGGIVGAITQNVVRGGLRDGFERPDDWLDSDDRACKVELAECLTESPF